MTKGLLYLSLIFTPIAISISLLPLIPTIQGVGTRPPKDFLSLLFTLAIVLSAFFFGEIKAIKNKWLLIFLFYLPFSVYHSPPVISMLGQNNLGGGWQFEPFLKIVIYVLLIIAVASIDFTKKELKKGFAVVSVMAVLMALYVIVQKLNIDQFFTVKGYSLIGSAMEPKLIGTLGNSTLVSCYLVMCLPFLLYLKKWWKTIIIIIAVILCKSNMSNGVMGVCLLSYVWLMWPKCRLFMVILAVLAGSLATYGIIKYPNQIKARLSHIDNGRVDHWKQVIEDIQASPINQDLNTPGLSPEQIKYLEQQNEKKYAMTGLGMGSFEILFSERHKWAEIYKQKFMGWRYPRWGNPHNIYIHIAYSLGIIGLGLFLICIWKTMIPALFALKSNSILIPPFICMVSVILFSCATFPLLIEPCRIYATISIGLLLNRGLLDAWQV